MNATVVVAALGFVSTLAATWLAAHLQRRGARAAQIRDAQIRIYGECAASLYEYERATYNRVKARLESRPEVEREELRQVAYLANTQARAVVGQAAFLSGKPGFRDDLEAIRKAIGDLNKADDRADARQRHGRIQADLARVLGDARSDLFA